MKDSIILILMLIGFSCGISSNQMEDKNDSNINKLTADQEYIYREFKRAYMRYCLNYGSNLEYDSTFFANDNSLAGDFPLGLEGMKMVDSLARIQRENIKQDSIYLYEEIHLRNPEYQHYKRVILYCLNGYDSEEIDSIAMVLSKKFSP